MLKLLIISYIFLSESKEFRDSWIFFNIGIHQHKQNLIQKIYK